MASNAYGLRLLAKPGVRHSVIVLLALVAVVYRLLQFASLTRQIQWGYDFSAYWSAAGRLLDGLSPYVAAQLAGPYGPQQQFLYLYPPPLAAAVTPLAALFPGDYRGAAWVWAAIGFVILVTSVVALWRAEGLGQRFPLLAGRGRWLLVAGALAFPPAVGELVMGNVHLVLLGLLTVVWLGIRRGTTGGEWIAGFAVGAAAVIKVFPGLLLLWFLLTRRSRAAAGTVIGAVAVAAAALPLTGSQPWLDFPTVLLNLSAPTDTTDTLAPTVWLTPVLGFELARWLVTGIGLAVVVLAARALDASRGFGVTVMASVLVAPALYHHYLALAVLPLLLALSAGVPLRWLALAYLLMSGGQQDAIGEWSWVVNRGLPTAGALALVLVPYAPRPQESMHERGTVRR